MNKQEWLGKCSHWKKIWPQLDLPEFEDDSRGVNLYKFISVLNKNLKEDSCIVSDAGSALYVPSQGLQLNGNQRFILDAGQAGMGAAIPMSVGVSLARNNKKTIVITGDGSFSTNIQELAVIKYHFMDTAIFVWNNSGYLSIKNSQLAFYGGRIFGTDSNNGLFFPDIKKIADSYGLWYDRVDKNIDLDYIIRKSLKFNHPIIVEVICDPDQKIMPSLAFKNGKSCPLNDMSPYISDEQMNLEMIKD
jgi:acetolactate synthase-1/2/3 large subunit